MAARLGSPIRAATAARSGVALICCAPLTSRRSSYADDGAQASYATHISLSIEVSPVYTERMATPFAPPRDPLDAVTHPDPYPYYRDLVAQRPLAYDETLGGWVAASAAAVRATLSSGSCRVIPVGEPVPAA